MRKIAVTHARRARGLALTELLICSSIAAMMLTATAVAFRASIASYQDNTERNLLVTAGRAALRQIIQEIRTADAHGPVNDSDVADATTRFASGLTTETTGIELLKRLPDVDDPGIVASSPATWVTVTYRFDAANRQILKTRQVGAQTPVTMVVASFVQDFRVRMEPTRSAANIAAGDTSFDILLRAVVTMELANRDAEGLRIDQQGSGDTRLRLVDAAMPRKSFSGL